MLQKILQLITRKITGLNRVLKFFSVDFTPIDTNGIIDKKKVYIYIWWNKHDI